jgi:hypothetical protein
VTVRTILGWARDRLRGVAPAVFLVRVVTVLMALMAVVLIKQGIQDRQRTADAEQRTADAEQRTADADRRAAARLRAAEDLDLHPNECPGLNDGNGIHWCSGGTHVWIYDMRQPDASASTSVTPVPSAGACVPATCASLKLTCGGTSDGCGGDLYCGTCYGGGGSCGGGEW